VTRDIRPYSNRQTPETPKQSRLSGPSVSRRDDLSALLLPRTREHLAPYSLQIAQIAEMSLPARVEILAGRESRGVVMSVEQLVHQARQLLDRC
jgi:hypothetical protein